MNLSQFKKVRDDAQTAILKHPKGHEIRIAKKGLTAKLKEQLAELPLHLAEGGDTNQIPYDTLLAQQAQSNAPYGVSPAMAQVASNDPFADTSNPSVPVSIDRSQATPLPVANYNLNTQAAPQAQPAQGVPGIGNYQGYSDAFVQQQQGIQDEAKAVGEQGNRNSLAAAENVNQLTRMNQDYQARMKHLTNQSDSFVTDYAQGHINPNHYLENMGAGQKIATAIGLILGGIGGGLTHQQNPALQFLQGQIDRDIESQKADIGKKQNLLSAAFHMTGNERDAVDLAKSLRMGILASQFQQAGAQAQDPAAKARAEQIAARLKIEGSLPLMNQVAIRQTLLGQNQSSQMVDGHPVRSNVDPAIQARFLAPDEATRGKAMTEIQQQDNINSMNSNAMDSFDHVTQLQSPSQRIGSPIQSAKQIDALWEPMMDKLVKQNEGRVTPITVDLMSSLKPRLTDDAQTIALKRAKLYNILNSERSTPTLTSLGINMPKNIGMAKPNPNVIPGYRNASTR